MNISVERFENPESWNTELENFRGSIFMTREWLDSISRNDRTPIYLTFVKDGEVLAFLGGLEILNAKIPVKELFFYSGIVYKTKDPEVLRGCKSALYEFAKKNKYYRISMKSYDHNSYVPAKLKQFKESQRKEYIIYLNKEKEEIHKDFDRELGRMARKAKREGVILKNSYSTSLTEKMFELMAETHHIRQSKGYGKYNSFYMPFFKHEEINKLITTGHASFYYAEYRNEILIIQLIYTWQRRSYALLMGTSLNSYHLNASTFLFYEIAGALKDLGFLYYNLGGIPQGLSHIGLKKYKEKLGTVTVASTEEVTDLITFPLNLLNPFLNLNIVKNNRELFPGRLEGAIIKSINIILNKR